MQQSPSFIVKSAHLTPSERIINVTYTETISEKAQATTLGAKAFEKYLQCMHTVECPSIGEWWSRASEVERFTWLATFMECLMWEAQDEVHSNYDLNEKEAA